MVDLLPAGLSVVDYTMSNTFEQSPGARVDAVSNYNNTGRTAVIWTADSIPASAVTNNTMAVGAITAKVSGEAATGRITNDVYLTSTTEDMVYGNKVDNPPAGNGTWSKAEVSDPMLLRTCPRSRKSVTLVGHGPRTSPPMLVSSSSTVLLHPT